MKKILTKLGGVLLSVIACAGILLAAVGFILMGLAFSIAEQMEDVDDS